MTCGATGDGVVSATGATGAAGMVSTPDALERSSIDGSVRASAKLVKSAVIDAAIATPKIAAAGDRNRDPGPSHRPAPANARIR